MGSIIIIFTGSLMTLIFGGVFYLFTRLFLAWLFDKGFRNEDWRRSSIRNWPQTPVTLVTVALMWLMLIATAGVLAWTSAVRVLEVLV